MTTAPRPEVPEDLVRAIGAGQCVAFVGAGFSAATVPSWARLLEDVASQAPAAARDHCLRLLGKRARTALDYEAAAQALRAGLGEEEFVEVPPDKRVCPRCGKPYAEMSDTEDSEQVEIEIRIYRHRTRRKRHRSTCQCYGCTRTVTAPCPAKVIGKSRLGTSLWAHILLDKFSSHRPTARLLEELKQHGLDLAAGTVADGLRRLEPMFAPHYEALL